MASTNKTTNLGLNNWIETDSPKRSDFVSDNIIIDNLVGNHIKDMSLHLTADEKDRATRAFDVNTIYGTGESSTTIKFSYTPRVAIICMKNAPFTQQESDYVTVNSAVASEVGTTGGINISQYTVTVNQSKTATNGVFHNLNCSGREYILITFK